MGFTMAEKRKFETLMGKLYHINTTTKIFQYNQDSINKVMDLLEKGIYEELV
jgi:hypothetical protein